MGLNFLAGLDGRLPVTASGNGAVLALGQVLSRLPIAQE